MRRRAQKEALKNLAAGTPAARRHLAPGNLVPTTKNRMETHFTAVITGASAGLGRAIAHEFGKQGARVALISRDAGALEATAREVEELGGKALALTADVSDDAAVESAAARVEEELG